jgi:hypothetical protein
MVKIEFQTDNAAFENDDEIEKILKHLACLSIFWDAPGSYDGPIYESNGNKIGQFNVKLTKGS